MIPDLTEKAPFLFTLVPTLFWTTFLVDFNMLILVMALAGAVFSGIHLAIIEAIKMIPDDENVKNRLEKLFCRRIISTFFLIIGFYAVVSYAGLINMVVLRFDSLQYYQWGMIIITIILGIGYVVGILISPEKKEGYEIASHLGTEDGEE